MADNAKIILDESTKIRDGSVTDYVVERTTREKEIEVTEYIDRMIQVPKAAADVPVNFGGLTTASFIRIESDEPIKIKIDDTGNPEIPVTSLFVLHGSMTALYVSGDSLNDAVVKFLIGGV